MVKKRYRFFICGKCRMQLSGISKPIKCPDCDSKDIGEIQIKWLN